MWMMLLSLNAALAAEPNLAAHMQQHFVQATQIQAAVIDADLERARQLACWMAEHELRAGLPAGWQPYVADLQARGRQIREAANLAAAADAVAAMALACGACHQKFEVRTWLNSSSHEPLGEDIAARMGRHRWAADRLWEGLIGPLEESWLQGADALAEAPLHSERLLGEEQLRADLLANQVHRLGADARRAAAAPARARIYGRLLSICAECHRLYRSAN